MNTQVIVLNGGSSSGKTEIAQCLKAILPKPWINLGVDDLLDRLPPSLLESPSGASIGPNGEVILGQGFREIENAWLVGTAAMARAGARIIIDDVFLGGADTQERIRARLEGLEVLWVGVRCDPNIAHRRELARGDRVVGMAVSQAAIVHVGVAYDLEVDTSHTGSLDCARAIAALAARAHPGLRKCRLFVSSRQQEGPPGRGASFGSGVSGGRLAQWEGLPDSRSHTTIADVTSNRQAAAS